LDYLKLFATYPFSVRRFLNKRLTLEEARRIVSQRLENRAQNFLRLVERSIYGYPRSPYLPLLKMAGCELGDLRELVKRCGLEEALKDLREAGVYIRFEEFKGRQPIRRNGLSLATTPHSFDNPFTPRDFSLPTGGSTGKAVSAGVNLENIAARMPAQM